METTLLPGWCCRNTLSFILGKLSWLTTYIKLRLSRYFKVPRITGHFGAPSTILRTIVTLSKPSPEVADNFMDPFHCLSSLQPLLRVPPVHPELSSSAFKFKVLSWIFLQICQLLMKFIPPQERRIGEFIDIWFKKISPARILSQLDACNFMNLAAINHKLSRLPAIELGSKYLKKMTQT